MSDPYIGEIRMFAGNFAPAGWELCQGQLVPIAEFDALFTLLGTMYGGDGQTTFALPDLRGRVPLHNGQGPGLSQNYLQSEMGGAETVTLTTQQIPIHTHPMTGSTDTAQDTSPTGKVVGQIGGGALTYIQDSTDSDLAPQAVTPIGGSQPHENLQPYLCINYIISMYGIYPSPT